MSKYAERLSKDDKQIKQEAVALKEAASKASVQKFLAEADQRAVTLNQAYESSLAESPLNVAKVASILKEQAENNEDRTLGQQILTEEFD